MKNSRFDENTQDPYYEYKFSHCLIDLDIYVQNLYNEFDKFFLSYTSLYFEYFMLVYNYLIYLSVLSKPIFVNCFYHFLSTLILLTNFGNFIDFFILYRIVFEE
jgi:hypothetical protein